MLEVVVVAADVEVDVVLREQRAPRLLQDAVVPVGPVAEQRVVGEADRPRRRPRLGQLRLEPMRLGRPPERAEAVLVAVEDERAITSGFGGAAFGPAVGRRPAGPRGTTAPGASTRLRVVGGVVHLDEVLPPP